MDNGYAMDTMNTLVLMPDHPRRLAPGSRIEVLQGIVWLTDTGGRDIFLSQGQTYALPNSGKILVEAIRSGTETALIRVSSPVSFRSLRSLLRYKAGLGFKQVSALWAEVPPYAIRLLWAHSRRPSSRL